MTSPDPNGAGGMEADPDNAEKKQDGGRFQKGKSGNPAGKRRGSRNRATVLLDKIATEQAQDILNATIATALAGDAAAQRLLLARIWPERRGRPIRLDLPPIRTAADASAGLEQLIGQVATGAVTPEEAAAVATLLEARIRWFETTELEARLARLEQRQENAS